MKQKLKKSKSKYELLAPAGNFAMLQAAINAGCDAIYFGLQDFNMRAAARNFKISDLPEIKKICESNKAKKIQKYLTLNTIIYDSEIEKVERIIKLARKYVDAIICWDLSVIKLCKKYKIPFHVSTQASVANTEAAEFYKKLGAERIILARELSLKQIKRISRTLPIECFIHGAMCVSISGRCFTSQFLFNKSANRGECIHPCRRAYTVKDTEGNELQVENNHIFSAKDLCTLPFIEQLKSSGIKAFKIEGRNRDVEYVSAVVGVYRKALDNKLSKTEIETLMEELKKVYNKGFSPGFYLGQPSSVDFSRSEHSQASEKKEYIGKVLHYFPNVGVAAVHASKTLKLGEEVLIIGNKTGLSRAKIESMQINHKSIDRVEKGQDVGIKLPSCRKGDEIYRIVKVKNNNS